MNNEKREYVMSEEAREAMRLYIREWRKKNPERTREIQRDYVKRRKEREQKGGGDGESEG
jgi:hypothetical protein